MDRREFMKLFGKGIAAVVALTMPLEITSSKSSVPNSDCPNCHGIITPTTKPCGEVYVVCGHPSSAYFAPIKPTKEISGKDILTMGLTYEIIRGGDIIKV